MSHPVPDGQHQRSLRSAYRTTGPDPVGVSTFHMRKTRPVRVPPLPRGGGVQAIGQMRPTATCCFPAASPAPRHHIHLSEAHLDEVSTAIHSRSPIRPSPHLRPLDGTTTASAFPRASHPAVTSNACRGGDRHRTHARDHVIDNIADPSFQRVHLLHATSCRTIYEMSSCGYENLTLVSHIFPQKTGISCLKRRNRSKVHRWIKAKAGRR